MDIMVTSSTRRRSWRWTSWSLVVPEGGPGEDIMVTSSTRRRSSRWTSWSLVVPEAWKEVLEMDIMGSFWTLRKACIKCKK